MAQAVGIPKGPLTITPLPRPPMMNWTVPGSKSITNRALVLAALARGTTTLSNVLSSDDTLHMRRCLEQLGIGFEDVDETTLRVFGGVERLRRPAADLFVGNSGTTVRFLTALAAVAPGPVTLVGDEHMQKRPISDLVDGLRQLGVRIDCASGCPPLSVHGGKFQGGALSMRGDRSSQYFSAVMLVGGLASSPVEIRIAGELVSRPYVEITRQMVSDFGGEISVIDGGFRVHPVPGYVAREYAIEPDASSASYPFALAAATRGSIAVKGLGVGAVQGDHQFVNLLEQAGAEVEQATDGTRVHGRELRGIDVDMHHISDTVMTLAAIAPLAEGPTTIRNVANIRIKETDRLEATVNELRRLGQEVSFGDDWLRVEPRPIRPATVRCYSDHRMAMSFAVLGLSRPGITIEDPACVTKTYPTFWNDVAACYRSVGATPPW
jgi:3-phosphoshikimate 1-carboxyvinyltransferase